MLDVTLNTKFRVGTNLRGDMASADWRFLLPSLRVECILCVGVPELPTLAVLSTMCDRLVVAARNARKLSKLRIAASARGITNLQPVLAQSSTALPCLPDSIDVLYLSGDRDHQRSFQSDAVLRALSRIIKPDGVIYFEAGLRDKHLQNQDDLKSEQAFGLSRQRVFRITPRRGEMRTAIPVHDTITASYFEKHVLETPSLLSRTFSIVDQLTGKQRYALVTQRSAMEVNGHLPEYLSSLAQENGMTLDGYRWGMSAMGRRNTRKVLFFLLNKASGKAEAIIKLTRNAAFNARLENEYRALDHLTKTNVVCAGKIPRPLFFGYRGNLAILGEGIIHGRPFRKSTTATVTCPLAHAAFEFVLDLGAKTAVATVENTAKAADVLNSLLNQIREIYKLSDQYHTFLAKQIEVIASSGAKFPTVFQHGDPGIWNLMATDKGGVAFLDWEAAEQQGMPLWDLFYLVRSYGTWMSRVGGNRNSLDGFAKHFFQLSELGMLLQRLTNQYCEQAHVDKRFIEPLFYTCWMHRALKEATRLTTNRIESGHYINLLRLCIDNRHMPGLTALFSLETGGEHR